MPQNGQIQGPDVIADDVLSRIAQLNDSLEKTILTLNKVEQAAKNAFNTGQLNSQASQANQINSQANETLRERTRLETALARQTERNRQITSQTNRELVRQRVITQEQTRNIKRQETANNSLVGAYRRLSAQLNIAKELYKDLAVEQGANSAAARRQAAEVQKLQTRVRAADQAVGDFQRNVGNYPTALRPAIGVIRQLVGAFGLVEGFRLTKDLISDSIRLAREAKGVEFAFDRIGDVGEDAFNRVKTSTRGLLSDLQIQKAIVEFDNFNLSLEDISTLLEFVALRSSQTGRSIESLRDSLVEGLSKESLRRLDNLGISMIEIRDTAEELGVGVNKAFTLLAGREIARAGNQLDEAANSANKFDAAVENLQINLGKTFTTFKGLSLFIVPLQSLGFQLEQINFFLSRNISFVDKITAIINTATTSGRAYNQSIINEAAAREEVEKQIQAQIDAYIKLNKTIGPLAEGQKELTNNFSLYVDEQDRAVRSIGEINEEIKKQQELLNKATTRDQVAQIQATIEALERQRDALLGITDVAEGSIKFYQNYISEQKRLQSETAKTTAEFEAFQRAIDIAQGKILALQGVFNEFEPGITQETFSLSDLIFFDEEDENIFSDIDNLLNTEGLKQGMESLARELQIPIEQLYAQFRQLYEDDFAAFLQFSQDKIEATEAEKDARLQIGQEIAQGIADIGGAIFDLAETRSTRELDRANEVLDSIITSKNATDEQIEAAEIKREENEKKLAKAREKRLRNEFLLNQAANVAQAFLSKSQAEIALLAQSRLLPPGVSEGYVAAIQTLINTQFAVSLATILAQSLPKFFRGKGLQDGFEGLATWGEAGREVKVGKEGRLEVSPATTTPTYVNRDDLILKNIPLFKQQMQNPASEVYKRVSSAWRSDTKERQMIVAPQAFNGKNLEKTIDKGLKKGFKGIDHKINIINRVEKRRVTRY